MKLPFSYNNDDYFDDTYRYNSKYYTGTSNSLIESLEQKPSSAPYIIVTIIVILVLVTMYGVKTYNEIQYTKLKEKERAENYSYAIAALENANFSDAKLYMEKIENYTDLYPEECEYIEAGILLENGEYKEALQAFNEISYFVPDSVKDLARDGIYSQAKSLYLLGQYFNAELLFARIPDYKNTSKYVALIIARENKFRSSDLDEQYNRVAGMLTFADAKDVITESEVFMNRFLKGSWKSADKSYYINVDEGFHFNYNLPNAVYGQFCRLRNGIYQVGNERGEYGFCTKYFNNLKFTIQDINTIEVYCYKNEQTYKLYRQ